MTTESSKDKPKQVRKKRVVKRQPKDNTVKELKAIGKTLKSIEKILDGMYNERRPGGE